MKVLSAWSLYAVLIRAVKKADFTDKVSFEQRPERSEGVSHVAIWARALQVEGKQVPKPCVRKVVECS